MSTFAKIDDKNIVVDVIVAEQDIIDSGVLGNPKQWIQTSRNTREGVHAQVGGVALRKNYAGIGYTYDSERDAFIPPKKFESWILDEFTCTWRPPIPEPSQYINDNGKLVTHSWNEDTLNWQPYECDVEEDGAVDP